MPGKGMHAMFQVSQQSIAPKLRCRKLPLLPPKAWSWTAGIAGPTFMASRMTAFSAKYSAQNASQYLMLLSCTPRQYQDDPRGAARDHILRSLLTLRKPGVRAGPERNWHGVQGNPVQVPTGTVQVHVGK